MTIASNIRRLKNRWLARIYARLPSLGTKWGANLAADRGQVPWSETTRPLHQATVALVTTGGVHLVTQRPFDMASPTGDASWRAIPVEAPTSELTITHDYYDHRDADRDPNLVLPAERLLELEVRGVLGSVHRSAYSFMGHIDGSRIDQLVGKTAPEVGRILRNGGVDYALLVPA